MWPIFWSEPRAPSLFALWPWNTACDRASHSLPARSRASAARSHGLENTQERLFGCRRAVVDADDPRVVEAVDCGEVHGDEHASREDEPCRREPEIAFVAAGQKGRRDVVGALLRRQPARRLDLAHFLIRRHTQARHFTHGLHLLACRIEQIDPGDLTEGAVGRMGRDHGKRTFSAATGGRACGARRGEPTGSLDTEVVSGRPSGKSSGGCKCGSAGLHDPCAIVLPGEMAR